MIKNTTEPKKTRTQYSQSYKDDALALAERIGFAKAEFGINPSDWKKALDKIAAYMPQA